MGLAFQKVFFLVFCQWQSIFLGSFRNTQLRWSLSVGMPSPPPGITSKGSFLYKLWAVRAVRAVQIRHILSTLNVKWKWLVKSISWTLAEFRHNRIVQSPHDSTYVGNIKKSDWGLMKTMIYVSSGRNPVNILFNLHNQMQGVKKLNRISGCWK